MKAEKTTKPTPIPRLMAVICTNGAVFLRAENNGIPAYIDTNGETKPSMGYGSIEGVAISRKDILHKIYEGESVTLHF